MNWTRVIQYTKVAAIFLMGEIVSELKDTYDIMDSKYTMNP